MPKYHYRPKGNRTPVTHPVFGHLTLDGEYDHPDCANHPDFVEVKAEKSPDPEPAAESVKLEVEVPDPVTKSPGMPPAKAGKPGRS